MEPLDDGVVEIDKQSDALENKYVSNPSQPQGKRPSKSGSRRHFVIRQDSPPHIIQRSQVERISEHHR